MDFNLFSKNYEELFLQNIQKIFLNVKSYNQDEYIDKEYTVFFPSCGTNDKSKIKFIFYGQAPNGWRTSFYFPDLIKNQNEMDLLLKKAISSSNFASPMNWVNENWYPKEGAKEYAAYRSFFWNVVYKFINCYNLGHSQVPNDEGEWFSNDDWCNHLVWSNLMKLSPAEGGNPDGNEQNFQMQFSKKLFAQELEEIQPAYAILLTNWKWAKNFLDSSGFSIETIENKDYLIAKGTFLKTKIIVTKRPFIGNAKKCINELLSLVSSF